MAKVTTIQLFKNVKNLIELSRRDLYAVANTTLTETYFHVGRLIIEHEQQGSIRAAYAKEILINLSERLTDALGKGFSVDNLENMRKFYLVYKEDYQKHISKIKKSEPLARKLKKEEKSTSKKMELEKSEPLARKLELSPFRLSWTHYVMLLKIENPIERKFYEIESASENWSKRELQRQYESALFEKIALSHNKKRKIRYTLGKDNKQIFASKYKMYFPEKQLLKLIKEQP